MSHIETHPDFPILEFDPNREALISPGRFYNAQRAPDMPERCVMCFFQEVFDKLQAEGRLTLIKNLRSELGRHPVYRVEHNGQALAALHPGVGAPLAAGLLEETIWLGARRIVAVGGAGALDSEIGMGHIVIPTSAVRDEGTSYHYLPPSREVRANPEGIAAIERALARRGVAFSKGKTWTTDAFYRETPAKIERRRAEGCLVVEMEAAAFFAVAAFRQVTFGQILYSGDDVGGAEWNSRGWDRDATLREKLFWLAAEAALEL